MVVVSAMGDTTDDLITLAQGINANPYRFTREMDMLLTTGEQVSIALLTMAFNTLGASAVSLTGALAGVKTNLAHTKGRIVDIDPKRVREELDKAGCLEMKPTVIQPGEIWKESGRWDKMSRRIEGGYL